MVALATVLLLAAGQVAGCAGDGDESEPIGGTASAQREILVAAGAILTVLAAGIATSQEDD